MVDKNRIEHAKNYPILDLAERLGIEINKSNQAYCYNGHDSKTPSLTFYPTTNTFHCFGCKDGGDTIKFVRLHFRSKNSELTFKETIDFILGTKQSSPLPLSQNSTKTPLKPLKINQKEDSRKYNDIYEHFINMLPFPDENSYLVKERGLSLTVLKKNNIKEINPKETWKYRDKLLQKFLKKQLIKSSIIATNNKDCLYFYFLNSCAVIPFYKNGKITYLQGITSYDKRESHGKTSNLKGIQKPVLYIPHLLNQTSIYLCEGIITALYYTTYGHNSIAIVSGSDSPEKIIEELAPYKKYHFILCPDVDLTGKQLFDKLVNQLFLKGFKYDPQYLNIREYGRKLNIQEEKLLKIKDFNDLHCYIKKNKGAAHERKL
ncbi:toprim domain-containing protein [Candidatus Woesearchaeota archaeon]|nr:toprim domain-containing protein [Candidatus Woesearchaeota archaeon]